MQIAFDNSYARLPDRFHARLDPTPVAVPLAAAPESPQPTETALESPVAEAADLLTRVRAHVDAVRTLLAVVRMDPGVDESRAQAIRDVRAKHAGEKVIVFSILPGRRKYPWVEWMTRSSATVRIAATTDCART